MKHVCWTGTVLLALVMNGGPERSAPGFSPDQPELVQVYEDFRTDPGWEGVNNRIVGAKGPTVTQDFGWCPSRHAGAGPGEIGGTVSNSTTPATYGMKLGAFSLKDRLSASGRIAVQGVHRHAGVYVGFFNSTRQGWRPWSSMMLQLTASKPKRPPTPGKHQPGLQVGFTTIFASWGSDGMATDVVLPADGSSHTWDFAYDPEARVNLEWPNPALRNYVTPKRLAEDAIYARAHKQEPGLSRSELRRRLEAAADRGLLVHVAKRGTDFWWVRPDAARFRGAVTLRIDGGKPSRFFLALGNRDEPAVFDRFGVVNVQSYGEGLTCYLADLEVNGHKVDLSRDPGWEGKGNRVRFTETNFHGRHDFGFMETNWAGKVPGEIGGTFWQTEAIDPRHAYYADEVGRLSLDDPLAFSGNVCFVEGQPDSSMWIGFFNVKEKMAEIKDLTAGHPINQSLGILIEGPSRIGHYFLPFCAPTRVLAARGAGPVIQPTRDRHAFAFDYDPRANDGVGRITMRLDRQSYTLNLTRRQRAGGATFDRFGLANTRVGGKFVTIYFDDLTYTARRPKGHRPTRHEQQIITVPYPEGGRKY